MEGGRERERWELIWDLGLLKRFLCEGPVPGDMEEEMTREVGDGWGGLAQRKGYAGSLCWISLSHSLKSCCFPLTGHVL